MRRADDRFAIFPAVFIHLVETHHTASGVSVEATISHLNVIEKDAKPTS